MHDLDGLGQQPAEEPLRRHLARALLLVAVLGVLPFALDAHAVWQVLGPVVSVAIALRSLQLVWRAVFSTHPRYLARP